MDTIPKAKADGDKASRRETEAPAKAALAMDPAAAEALARKRSEVHANLALGVVQPDHGIARVHALFQLLLRQRLADRGRGRDLQAKQQSTRRAREKSGAREP